MKRCLACQAEFTHPTWICPICAWVPTLIEGHLAFSPELANQNDGIPVGVHHELEKLQEKSFWFRVRNQLIQDAILRYFHNAHDVLEIGCGSGYVLQGIRAILPTAKLTATEIYSYGLNYAARRVSPPTEFLQVDARKLPFKDEFDVIGAFDVLEHIEEDELVIKNFLHALKPEGGVILTVPQHPFLWSKVDEFACHKRRYKRKQLSSMLQQHGFNILLDTSFMFLLLPFMFCNRLIKARKITYDPCRELNLPKKIDKLFEKLLAWERSAVKMGIRFPIGGSRLVVAQLKCAN